MRACVALGNRQAFISYDSERFLRTLKEELVLPREWTSPTAFHHWLADYNATSLHSALSSRAPNVVEAEHLGHASLP